MKVSVQIPTFNQALLLKRAVLSAVEQDFDSMEVVVSDDGSDPIASEIALSLAFPKLKIFRNDVNLGRVKNYRHLLYDLVSGDWVVNLDGDDFFTDNRFLSRAMSMLESHSDAVLYMANIRKLKKIRRVCKSSVMLNEGHLLVDGVDFLVNYHEYLGFRHLASIYRRTLALESDFYAEDSLNSDFVSVMKLAAYGKFILSPQKVGDWNLNKQSASRLIAEDAFHQKNISAIKGLTDFLTAKVGSDMANRINHNLNRLQNYYRDQFVILHDPIFSSMGYLLRNIRFDLFYGKLLVDFFIKRPVSRLVKAFT